MKTLTEFSTSVLKAAIQAKKDLLAAGKTLEEIPAALGESLKLEGEKLTFVVGAIELVERKLEDLKRVVVMKLGEGEKAPGGVVQKGEHCFSAEYYPPLHPPKAAPGKDHRHDGKGRGDRKGGRGKGKPGRNSNDRNSNDRNSNDRNAGRRGERNPGGPRQEPSQAGGPALNGDANAGESRPSRRPPRQRPPRREDPATPPKPPGWVVKPKSDTATAPTDLPTQSTPAAVSEAEKS